MGTRSFKIELYGKDKVKHNSYINLFIHISCYILIGNDWSAVGRKAIPIIIRNISDVTNNGGHFICFKPFSCTSFPRYTIPLQVYFYYFFFVDVFY